VCVCVCVLCVLCVRVCVFVRVCRVSCVVCRVHLMVGFGCGDDVGLELLANGVDGKVERRLGIVATDDHNRSRRCAPNRSYVVDV